MDKTSTNFDNTKRHGIRVELINRPDKIHPPKIDFSNVV